MQKIEFKNKGEEGYENSKLNADNLNLLQDNVDEAISEVFESGTNTNGSYVKFKDGTMICWQPKVFQVSAFEQWGSLYRKIIQNPFIFPVSFTTYPTVVCGVRNTESGQLFGMPDGLVIDQNGINSLQLLRPTDSSGEIIINYFAIGKWK